ncbi:MAG TPA: NDP-sugar synthase [Nitrososphaerales archaeon]|nr:NDP-sugar synthase [Nitrososphaerales archaeon]
MKAVILAGGVGTRLRPLTYVMPKCLLPVGGVPLLEWTVRYLKSYGVSEFVVCVAYLKRQVMETIGDGSRLGTTIQYAEADSPLGTGGQLKTAERFIDGTFIAMNGDIVTSLDIQKLVARHWESKRIATIALKRFEVKVPYGHILTTPEMDIASFVEKPTLELMANAGVYVFDSKLFDSIPSGRTCSLESEVFPSLIAQGEKPAAYYEDAYWNDVGTLSDFERVNDEFLKQPVSVARNTP